MTAARLMLLGAALAPYLALVSVDAWMHEKARTVPRAEWTLHMAAAGLFGAFTVGVFMGASVAIPLFAAFVIVTAVDEFGFHRHLSVTERRVHFMAYAALALFVVAWLVSWRFAP